MVAIKIILATVLFSMLVEAVIIFILCRDKKNEQPPTIDTCEECDEAFLNSREKKR